MRQRDTEKKKTRAARPKHRITPTATQPRRTSGAALKEQLDRRTYELDEALQQQMATGEVLSIIRRSPADAQPVFDAIVRSAARLCDAMFGAVYLYEADHIRIAAINNMTTGATVKLNELQQLKRPNRSHLAGRAILDRSIIHVPDVLNDPDYSRELALAGGWRAVLAVPLLHDGRSVGAVTVAKAEPKPFSERQVQLLKTFADQALIAIDNVQLFGAEQQRTRELRESLQQQTATADVLKVISRSAFDLQRVFDTLIESAAKLCEADYAWMFRRSGDLFYWTAGFGQSSEEYARIREFFKDREVRPDRSSITGRCAIERKVIHVSDVLADPEYTWRGAQALGGYRAALGAPLLRDGNVVGVIFLSKKVAEPFTQKQIDLVTTFADQAVIAIENVRLFDEVQASTRELSESLEQQTATSEILEVISNSPTDTQPAFDAIVHSGLNLFSDSVVAISLPDRDLVKLAAIAGTDKDGVEALRQRYPMPLSHEFITGTAILDRREIDLADAHEPPKELRAGAQNLLAGGYSAMTVMPMMRGDETIGALNVVRRNPGPLSGKQRELLRTFAKQAVIAIENTRLFNELRESLQQQTATADVLKVISASPGELKPVFQAMLEQATRICDAKFGIVFRYESGLFHPAAFLDVPPAYADFLDRQGPFPPKPGKLFGQLCDSKTIINILDRADEPDTSPSARLGGARSSIAVPMLKDNELVGALFIYRTEVVPFTDKQIALVENFAAQAVIAIENTRLLNELRESLQQQTATADVLGVISSSPGELEPVFQTLLANAVRLCNAKFGTLNLYDGEAVSIEAVHNVPAIFAEARLHNRFRPHPKGGHAEVLRTKGVVHIEDIREGLAYREGDPAVVAVSDQGGARTIVLVPMLKDNALVGTINIYRQEVLPFSEKQIEVVKNFAAQAVIAIDNARLLNELRQRTDDLTQSLEYQTATADVLRVISSSPTDVRPVFDAIAESAVRLCEGEFSFVVRFDGNLMHYGASHGLTEKGLEVLKRVLPRRADNETVAGRAVLSRAVAQIPDIRQDPTYVGTGATVAQAVAYRSIMGVPLLHEGQPIGAIAVARGTEGLFSERQVALLTTFANQAVIAIENVRLFDEVQKRTDDLSESLEQQTATSEVLKVISSSSGQLQPVFETMLANATRICEAAFGSMLLVEGNALRRVALHNAPPPFVAFNEKNPLIPLGQVHDLNLLFETRRPVHIADAAGTEDSPIVKYGGARTLVIVPMVKESEVVGAIGIYRQEVRPFTDKQIELVTNFAAQAVIAIENTRLLNELRESLQQQTATADVLKVISRSTFDLQTVLQTLVESAARLCDADKVNITRQKNGVFYRAEAYGFSQEFMDYVRSIPIQPDRGSAFGRALLEGRAVHIPDVQADPEYTQNEMQRLGNYRTTLAVPMLREGVPTGVLTLSRSEVRPFTEKQTELASTFADQAAIAIENVRLFESVEARTRELAASLENLRTTQDRLVQTQKLASLGQLTAGIAHEIKNPLNFVNNFSGVSAELVDELHEALADVTLNEMRRSEIAELIGTLRGNLEKVVQHGKRADAIVKNMLLHSREGSVEHRVVDINALVEEGLNLAYHGARAEKQGFNIKLEKSFAPDAGEADVFPQDITRVLLNLISNGFYAATERRAKTNGGDYEPTLAAMTKNRGDCVEITIRDNGSGIPGDVKEKMFNPFFTTKPAGEGTGLGLSISHDIVVKQHGGSIEVDSQPGEFTEIRVILPRVAVFV